MRLVAGSVRGRVLLGALAAAAAALPVWILLRDSSGGDPAADIVRELERLEAEEAGQQSAEVRAVYQQAWAVARQLLERYSASPEAIDVAAWTLLQTGRPEEARTGWERCIAIAPGFGDGYFWLGQVARDLGDNAQAVERFRQAIEHQTTNRAAATLLAKSLEELGRFGEAAAVLEAEARSNPNYPGVLVLLGQVHLKSKDYAKAKEAFETALAADPTVPGGNYGLATAYERLGEPGKANERRQKAKQESRKEETDHRQSLKTVDDLTVARETLAGVWLAAGKVCYAHGDVAAAEEHWRRAAEAAPHQVESRLVLAWALQRQGKPDEAMKVLAEAAKTNSSRPDVYVRLAEVATSLKRFDAAEEALRDAIRIAPRSAFAYAALASLYLRMGRDPAAALAMIDGAIALEANNRQFRDLRESIVQAMRERENRAVPRQASPQP